MRVIGTLLVGTLCVTHVVRASNYQNLPDHDTPSSDFRNAPSGCLRPPPHGPRSRNPSSYSVMYNSDTSPSPTCSSSNHPSVTRPAMAKRRSRGKGDRGSRSRVPVDTSAPPLRQTGARSLPAMKSNNSSQSTYKKKKKHKKTKDSVLSAKLFEKIRKSVLKTMEKETEDNKFNQEVKDCIMEDSNLFQESKDWIKSEFKKKTSVLRQEVASWLKRNIQAKITKINQKKKSLEQQKEKSEKSLMQLQLDLFIVTTTTVFRELEEEGHKITPEIRQKFDPPVMYEEALNKDIPWRQWNAWLRNRIVTHLKGNVARRRLSSSTSRGVLQRLRRTRLRR